MLGLRHLTEDVVSQAEALELGLPGDRAQGHPVEKAGNALL